MECNQRVEKHEMLLRAVVQSKSVAQQSLGRIRNIRLIYHLKMVLNLSQHPSYGLEGPQVARLPRALPRAIFAPTPGGADQNQAPIRPVCLRRSMWTRIPRCLGWITAMLALERAVAFPLLSGLCSGSRTLRPATSRCW
jgi:hypothetical protein